MPFLQTKNYAAWAATKAMWLHHTCACNIYLVIICLWARGLKKFVTKSIRIGFDHFFSILIIFMDKGRIGAQQL